MKDVRRMVCDCSTSKEDRDMGYEACGEDCLNRMLYIEWYGSGFILFFIVSWFFLGGGGCREKGDKIVQTFSVDMNIKSNISKKKIICPHTYLKKLELACIIYLSYLDSH